MPSLVKGPEGNRPRYFGDPLLPPGMDARDAVAIIAHVAFCVGEVPVAEMALQWTVHERWVDFGPALHRAIDRPWVQGLNPIPTRGTVGPDVPIAVALILLKMAVELKARGTNTNVNRQGRAFDIYVSPKGWCDLEAAADFRDHR